MVYEVSEYSCDEVFCVNATGDCCVGDEISFMRATFSGSHSRPKFAGFVNVVGKIISDSYGAEKQQHTFTIEVVGGGKTLIKGRNLYKNSVYRKLWTNEADREYVLDEKHKRGNHARSLRDDRKTLI